MISYIHIRLLRKFPMRHLYKLKQENKFSKEKNILIQIQVVPKPFNKNWDEVRIFLKTNELGAIVMFLLYIYNLRQYRYLQMLSAGIPVSPSPL